MVEAALAHTVQNPTEAAYARSDLFERRRRLMDVLIEAWRREYNEERPKKGLGGLTPAQYAKRLIAERSTVTIGL